MRSDTTDSRPLLVQTPRLVCDWYTILNFSFGAASSLTTQHIRTDTGTSGNGSKTSSISSQCSSMVSVCVI